MTGFTSTAWSEPSAAQPIVSNTPHSVLPRPARASIAPSVSNRTIPIMARAAVTFFTCPGRTPFTIQLASVTKIGMFLGSVST